MDQIYLDNNATTPIDPLVAKVVYDCQNEGFVNPASQHQMGQTARRKLEKTRSEILKLVGAETTGMQADQLILTSGGTESNNLALIGLAHEVDGSVPANRRVLISAIEHPSLIGAAEQLRRMGFDVERIAVNRHGVVDLEDLEQKLETPTRLVSVMMVNNETGVIQPMEEIVELCQSQSTIVHTDAVQAVGKIPVDFSGLNVDALTLTAHKLHGPRGVGGLILRHALHPFPMLFGGFQQSGIRPGTENVCLAQGFLTALQQVAEFGERRANQVGQMRDHLEREILAQIATAEVIGQGAARVPHTSNIAFPGIDRQAFLMASDMAGLAISTGSACASGSSEPSPVLLAMGLNHEMIESAIRISLSCQNQVSEIDTAIQRIVKIWSNLQA